LGAIIFRFPRSSREHKCRDFLPLRGAILALDTCAKQVEIQANSTIWLLLGKL
jgi:hypothetical protein